MEEGGGGGGHFCGLAPIFARPKSEKCFKPAESPTGTLATKADFSVDRFSTCSKLRTLVISVH